MSLIIDPTALLRSAARGTAALAPRAHDLHGLRVALFENTKRNAAQFLDVVGDHLTKADDGVQLVRRTKHNFAAPMSDEMAAELKEIADVVVVGVGDCGSCSATAIADGIALEARGIPAVVVVTEAFEANARAIAEIEGAPDYEFVMIPHPNSNLSHDELVERVAAVGGAIRDRLTDKALVASTA